MTRPPKPGASPKGKPAPARSPATTGDRIAKVLSRAGISSRREAERLIALGQVAVNGKVIDSPALNIGPDDRVTVDGRPVGPAEPPRLWLYHKPEGLVTSARDEKGRDTVFDHLPADLPRVMPVGRLDLTSEGLLLLTNDGALKRRLELPSTGWLRKYRVRVKGNPDDAALEPLRRGITVEGEAFQPMTIALDRVQGANAWLTVGLREGRNREIRRAMAAIGLVVNRLIRVSYGPFRLDGLAPGEVSEVRGRVLRDQLGLAETPVRPEIRAETRLAPPGTPQPVPAGTDRPARTRRAADKPAARPKSATTPSRPPRPTAAKAPGATAPRADLPAKAPRPLGKSAPRPAATSGPARPAPVKPTGTRPPGTGGKRPGKPPSGRR